MSGWLVPPVTGSYTFWIAADNSGEFWLSTNADRANLVRVCLTSYVTFQAWDMNPQQMSSAISLVEGEAYYYEVRSFFCAILCLSPLPELNNIPFLPMTMPLFLVSHQLQALQKENTGGDHISIAWACNTMWPREVVPAAFSRVINPGVTGAFCNMAVPIPTNVPTSKPTKAPTRRPTSKPT